MKEPVVSDSTCLICLERIGQLELLPSLFEPFFVPPEVHKEFSVTPSWLQVQAPKNITLVQALRWVIDEGEAEAIALAVERKCLLIVDDRKARGWARRLGIRVIGTIGVLLKAKRAGLIDSVKPLLERLKSAGFYLTQELEQEALRLAEEG